MESWLEHFARANFRRSADTAHDLKTPLNVAVLNLELLRMRLRKIAPDDDSPDEKISDYTRAIETELRRLGRIFDAFFLLSTPPAGNDDPAAVDIASLLREAAATTSIALGVDGAATVTAHESRIRQAVQLFFESAAKLLDAPSALAETGSEVVVTIEGTPRAADFEPTKIFKFYYTDPDGNPDLSLAVARLIAETYGGEINAAGDHDKVALRLSFPLGAE